MDTGGPSTGLALWARARYIQTLSGLLLLPFMGAQEGVWERLVSIFLTSKGAQR